MGVAANRDTSHHVGIVPCADPSPMRGPVKLVFPRHLFVGYALAKIIIEIGRVTILFRKILVAVEANILANVDTH